MIIRKFGLAFSQGRVDRIQMLSVMINFLSLRLDLSLQFIDLMLLLFYERLYLAILILKALINDSILAMTVTLLLSYPCNYSLFLLYLFLILQSKCFNIALILIPLLLNLKIALLFNTDSFLCQVLKLRLYLSYDSVLIGPDLSNLSFLRYNYALTVFHFRLQFDYH